MTVRKQPDSVRGLHSLSTVGGGEARISGIENRDSTEIRTSRYNSKKDSTINEEGRYMEALNLNSIHIRKYITSYSI